MYIIQLQKVEIIKKWSAEHCSLQFVHRALILKRFASWVAYVGCCEAIWAIISTSEWWGWCWAWCTLCYRWSVQFNFSSCCYFSCDSLFWQEVRRRWWCTTGRWIRSRHTTATGGRWITQWTIAADGWLRSLWIRVWNGRFNDNFL